MCRKHYKRDAYWRNVETEREKLRQRSPEKQREYNQRNYERHQEQRREARRDYYTRNAAAARQASRDWAAKNPERVAANKRHYAEMNRDKLAAYYREYQRTNVERRRASNAKRRAAIRSTTVDPVDYAAILVEHGMTCHLCGASIESFDDLHFDHVVPLSRGGTHTADNIRPAHELCNLRKGSKLMEELKAG
jgi:5-methylcytosine-specific restriction endonuclease McrA